MSGALKDIYSQIKPELQKAITGKEFDGIPFSMLSTDQTAIVGLMPGLYV